MDLLATGREYTELPDTYIIFICDFDPFGQGKYRYTFRHMCQETSDVDLADGSVTIFLSTKGRNKEEVSPELVKFLEYIGAELDESTEDFADEFVKMLQKTVSDIKQSRRMGERYMLTELLMQDERKAGRIEGRKESILEFLLEIGSVPDNLRKRIMQEDNLEQLRKWAKLVARVDSIEQFMNEM